MIPRRERESIYDIAGPIDRLFLLLLCDLALLSIAVAFVSFHRQVKSRMQNQLQVEGQTPKYRHTIPSLITVTSEEGLAAVYK